MLAYSVILLTLLGLVQEDSVPTGGLGPCRFLPPRASGPPDLFKGTNSGLGRGLEWDRDSRPDSGLQLGVSPINAPKLCFYLEKYPNRREAQQLKRGFTQGFELGFQGESTNIEACNLKSAKQNPDILKEKIQKEIEHGRFAGPFKSATFW